MLYTQQSHYHILQKWMASILTTSLYPKAGFSTILLFPTAAKSMDSNFHCEMRYMSVSYKPMKLLHPKIKIRPNVDLLFLILIIQLASAYPSSTTERLFQNNPARTFVAMVLTLERFFLLLLHQILTNFDFLYSTYSSFQSDCQKISSHEFDFPLQFINIFEFALK